MPVTPSTIDEIHIQNFKFFPKLTEPIKLEGKHWLLLGENGSGKSSIYWALYTLLECANKEDVEEMKKYFDPDPEQEEKLINVHIQHGTPEWVDSYIKMKLSDNTEFKVSEADTSINSNTEAKESNYASDFINYRNLLSLYNFAHSTDIDLFNFFTYAVFPYVKLSPATYWRKNLDGSFTEHNTSSASEIWEFVQQGPRKNLLNAQGDNRYPKSTEQQYTDYKNLVSGFRASLEGLLTYINTEGNPILKDELGYDLTFKLELSNKIFYMDEAETRPRRDPFKLSQQKFKPPKYYIKLSIPEYEGKANAVLRPHSFLNEAKLTAIGLALRLAVLKKALETREPKLKLLVLDDLLISLDMSNREKVLTHIFTNYLNSHQLLIFTHDKVFFEFVKLFITQKSNQNDWKISEMYSGVNGAGKPYPIIIDNDWDYYEKAKRYFEANDYTTSSLYIRKALEQLVKERLPDEFKADTEGKPKNLQHLWTKCLERYNGLHYPISSDISDIFAQTKLMLLNPQAHHNFTQPVYKLEIEKALKLIHDIITNCAVPAAKILISKGMKMQYVYSSGTDNYSIDFELLTDFKVDGLAGNTNVVAPRCKVLTWQYNDNEYWDFRTNTVVAPSQPEKTLIQIRDVLIGGTFVTLPITNNMFLDDTKLTNGVWTLREIVNKAGITL